MKLYLEDRSWIETDHFYDLSIPMVNSEENLRAWYVDPPVFEPVRANGFVGSVKEGGSVNFRNIFFNPHGHGTHTECLGHITKTVYSINKTLKTYLCKCAVISIEPIKEINPMDGKEDHIILPEMIHKELEGESVEALIIRTIPNPVSKRHTNYSSKNPAYLHPDCIQVINSFGVRHLMIDTPSVDREEDGGELAFHHAFWRINEGGDFERTITELIFVPDEVEDGVYLLDLQLAPFENDASPSRPVIYPIHQ